MPSSELMCGCSHTFVILFRSHYDVGDTRRYDRKKKGEISGDLRASPASLKTHALFAIWWCETLPSRVPCVIRTGVAFCAVWLEEDVRSSSGPLIEIQLPRV